MEKMDVDGIVVDLSISSRRSSPQQILTTTTNSLHSFAHARKVLRPLTEPRSYVEGPDVVINGLDKPHTNGNVDYSSESSGGEMPPLAPIKKVEELRNRERGLRRLREELRAKEMKLVLLRKLKQSQLLKENVAVVPPNIPQSTLPPTGLLSGLGITPTTVKIPSSKTQQPQFAHSRHSSSHNPVEGSSHNNRTNSSVPEPPQRLGRPRGFPPGIKDISGTIMPVPSQPQTPAQRQAAAKLSLRKQLEKTFLQIPQPKPPPPEMHFIPNPSNAEFIYLVGLELVVDFSTKDAETPISPQPFSCSQCQSDFTPVWKWESKSEGGEGKDLEVVCEQCVTTNVKKALKAEHTNTLRTAFVKALQQEQEIEERLAQNNTYKTTDLSVRKTEDVEVPVDYRLFY